MSANLARPVKVSSPSLENQAGADRLHALGSRIVHVFFVESTHLFEGLQMGARFSIRMRRMLFLEHLGEHMRDDAMHQDLHSGHVDASGKEAGEVRLELTDARTHCCFGEAVVIGDLSDGNTVCPHMGSDEPPLREFLLRYRVNGIGQWWCHCDLLSGDCGFGSSTRQGRSGLQCRRSPYSESRECVNLLRGLCKNARGSSSRSPCLRCPTSPREWAGRAR